MAAFFFFFFFFGGGGGGGSILKKMFLHSVLIQALLSRVFPFISFFSGVNVVKD